MARHNNVKIYNVFYRKNVLFAAIPVNVDRYTIKSRLYNERWDKIESSQKGRTFIIMHIFS